MMGFSTASDDRPPGSYYLPYLKVTFISMIQPHINWPYGPPN